MGTLAPQAEIDRSRLWERAATRSAILAAARRVAEHDGILEMSLTDVAKEAGFAPTSVYAYFTSKNDLLLSVIADDLTTLARAMRGAFGISDDHEEMAERERQAIASDATQHQSPPAPAETPHAGEVEPASSSPVTPRRISFLPHREQPSEPQPDNSEGTVEAIARLQDIVAKLEARPVDAWLERRLREFERALASLEGRRSEHNTVEATTEERFRGVIQRLSEIEQDMSAAADAASREMNQRLDGCEKRLRELVSDAQADAGALAMRVTTLENAAFAARPELFVAPVPPERNPASEQASGGASAQPVVAAEDVSLPSFLASARRSAHVASVAAVKRGRKVSKRKSQTMVYLSMGALFLFVALLTAMGLLLRNQAMTANPVHASPIHEHAPSAKFLPRAAQADPQSRLRRLAQAGDPEAELLVGLELLRGDGMPVNEAAAYQWLSRAAAKNQPLAQYQLGLMYKDGRGVQADAAQAFHWFESAALNGNRRAMHNVAIAYAEGWGTAKDPSEAAHWFTRAAALGSVNDQFNLGVLYERGMGVPQSLTDAYKWYAIAAAQGDQESQARIAALAPTLAPDDLAAARSASESFKPDAEASAANLAPKLAQRQ